MGEPGKFYIKHCESIVCGKQTPNSIRISVYVNALNRKQTASAGAMAGGVDPVTFQLEKNC